MSRSALWRQEGNAQERERQAQDLFLQAIEDGKNNRTKNLVPLWGNVNTFNLNPVLLQNISKSPYFVKKCLQDLQDWSAVVDEIYYEVKHLEPWNGVSAKSPSTAFCLLVRLFTLRMTEKQMNLTLNHADSPYIRGIGFLYLRFAGDPNQLWDYCQPYLFDPEPIQVTNGPPGSSDPSAMSTIGDLVRGLLIDREYHGTLLPRLPHALEQEIQVKLLQAEKIEKRAAEHYANKATMDYFTTLGSKVQAMYEDEQHPVAWYSAVIDRVMTIDDATGVKLQRPKFVVTFVEYGNTEIVTLGELDMPGKIHASPTAAASSAAAADKRGYDSRGGAPHVHVDRRDGKYERDRRPHPSNERGYHGDARRGRGYDRGRGGGDGGGDRHWQRNGGESTRARRKDDANDGDDLYEQVRRREREKASARNKRDYSARPPTTKASLTISNQNNNKKRPAWNEPSDGPPAGSHAKRPHAETTETPPAPSSSLPSPSNAVARSAEELAAIEDKKRKLMAKYG